MPGKRLLASAVFAGYSILSVLFTYPLIKAPSATIEWGRGDPLLNAYILNWGARSLWRSPLRVFDASFYYPSANTLSLSDHLLSISWPLSPLAFLVNPLAFYNLAFLLSFLLSAWAFYAWLRLCGLSRFSAWIGGILFGFMPYRYAQLGHAQLSFTWWIPLTLCAFEAWIQRPRFRTAAMAGAAGASVFLASVYHGFFFLIFFGVFAAVRLLLLDRERARLPVCALQILVMIAAAGVLLTPSLLAYRANAARLPGAVSFSQIVRRGADLWDYQNPPNQSWLWGKRSWPGHPYSDFPWEMHSFPGTFALLSIPMCIGLLLWGSLKRQRELTVALIVSGLALFLVSLGPVVHFGGKAVHSVPIYGLLYRHFPGFFALRVPARASFYVALAGAAFSAIVLDRLSARIRNGTTRVILALIVTAAACLDLAPKPLPYLPPADYLRLRAAMAASEPARDDPGSDLVLPICDELNYAAPLASAPRFRPLVNGKSGYLLRLNYSLFGTLQRTPVPPRSLAIFRAIHVTRILIDRTRADMNQFEPLLAALRSSRVVVSDAALEGDFRALTLNWNGEKAKDGAR